MSPVGDRLRITGCLEVAVAAVIWGSNGVYVNLIPLSSYALAFFRVLFAAVALSVGIVLFGRRELFKSEYPLRGLFFLGVLLCLGWGLLFEAMKLLPIAEAVLLNYTAPIFVALLAAVFLRESVTGRTIASLILSFLGIVLIVFSNRGFQGVNVAGYLIGLSAGLSYAIFIIVSKSALTRVVNYTLVLYSNFFASLILAPSLFTIHLPLSWNVWLMLAILGVINTALAVPLFYKGLKKIRAQEAAILGYLEPVSAAFLGFLFLGQTLTRPAILGGILVIVAGYIVATSNTR